jgi:predicted ATPase
MGVLTLIDEPEISLHPTLQHALVHHLRAYAREAAGQVILATHSLEIVEALPGATLFLDHLERGSKTVPAAERVVAA